MKTFFLQNYIEVSGLKSHITESKKKFTENMDYIWDKSMEEKNTFQEIFYDPKSGEIILDKNGQGFLEGTACHFVHSTRKLALSGTSSLATDSGILDRWLDCKGRELNHEDCKKIARAYIAYARYGDSTALEKKQAFEAKKLDVRVEDLPPKEVQDVFRRMFSSEKGNQKDFSFLELIGADKVWRSSKEVRLWTFGSICWVVSIFILVLFFDPYNLGDFELIHHDQLMHMYSVMFFPPAFLITVRWWYVRHIR